MGELLKSLVKRAELLHNEKSFVQPAIDLIKAYDTLQDQKDAEYLAECKLQGLASNEYNWNINSKLCVGGLDNHTAIRHCVVTPETILMLKGMHWLGAGYYGAAYDYDDHTNYVYKLPCRPNDGYIVYASWCMGIWMAGNPDNLDIPHVYAVIPGKHCTCVIIEPLRSYDSNSYEDEDEFDSLRNGTTSQVIDEAFGWRGLDLHTGNIMFRNDGSGVITDPLSYFDAAEGVECIEQNKSKRSKSSSNRKSN